jgi:ABC-2 type transport system permease protein
MKALAIAGVSLRRMLRDRSALFFTILLPFFIILIVGSATKQFATNEVPVALRVGGSGAHTADLVRTLDHTAGLKITRVDDADAMRKALRRGLYAAGIVIPADYDARITAGRPVDVSFLSDQTRPQTAVRAAVAAAVAKEGAIVQAADFAAQQSHQPIDKSFAQARTTARIVPSVGVVTETKGTASKKRFVMTGFEYTAPAQLVLFVFITTLASAGIIIANRQQGITRRMYGTPTNARTIVLGETIARFAQAAFQALFVVIVGMLIFGVNFGNPIAAVVLISMFVLVATSVGLLAGTVFRTPEQAGSIGPPVGIAVGMLAGCMWPRFLMPLPMQRLGQLFPQSWAMDAFIKLIARGGGLRAIAPELAILAAYVIVLFPIATWRLRRSIVA